MKSTLILTLAAVFTLTASTAVAQANPSDNAKGENVTVQSGKTLPAKKVTMIKQMPAEISGIIEEISENEMKVKTQTGETYIVPLALFVKNEGFKDLGLAKGVNVTLKSLKPEVPATVTFSNSTDGAIAIKKLEAGDKLIKVDAEKIGKEKIQIIKAEMANAATLTEAGNKEIKDKLIELKEAAPVFFANEITANGKTIKVDLKELKTAIMKPFQVQPEEISGTVQSITGTEMTVKTKDGKIYLVPLVKLSEMEDFKALALKEGTEVSLKSGVIVFKTSPDELAAIGSKDAKLIISKDVSKDAINGEGSKDNVLTTEGTVDVVTVTGEEINVKTAPGAPVIKTFSIGSLEGNQIFIAGEITANGKTVKLQK